MKKIIKLTESDINKIVKRMVNEETNPIPKRNIDQTNIDDEILRAKKNLHRWIINYANSNKEELEDTINEIFIEHYVGSDFHETLLSKMEKSEQYKNLINMYALKIKYLNKRGKIDAAEFVDIYVSEDNLDVPYKVNLVIDKEKFDDSF